MKKPETTLEEKVLNTIRDRGLIPPGDKVIVGLSGGADSTALLHILYNLRQKSRWTLAAAHLNHGLRGAEADGDEQFAKSSCEKLKIEFFSKKIPEGELKSRKNLSLEEAARDARLAFLEEARRRLGARLIALGHHRDDQVETVLLRLLRGASLRGLAGMDFKSGSIVRPLLNVTRDEILEYCEENNIEYRDDSSNLDSAFLRNRIRHELLPLIEEKVNPNVRERVFHTARLLRRDSEFLEALSREWLEKCRKPGTGRVTLRRGKLADTPLPLLDRIWMAALYEASEETGRETDSRHLMELTGRLLEGKRGEVSLPGGLAARFTARHVEIGDKKSFRRPGREAKETAIPSSALDGGEVTFENYRIRFDRPDSPPEKPQNKQQNTEYFDCGKIGGGLKIRNWKRGDFFYPLGMNGKMKLSDFFINAKVEKGRRDRIPLLCDGENVVWVVGMRIDERYKIT
ncbi:MAG: tRNA lysidine(34) synthetase TilS, partial [bacterium]